MTVIVITMMMIIKIKMMMMIRLFLNNRIEHEKLHAKHKGHEAMHMEMLLILLGTLIVAQLLLYKWKSYHPRSYHVSYK